MPKMVESEILLTYVIEVAFKASGQCQHSVGFISPARVHCPTLSASPVILKLQRMKRDSYFNLHNITETKLEMVYCGPVRFYELLDHCGSSLAPVQMSLGYSELFNIGYP